MDLLETLAARAKSAPRHIVLPESTDARVVSAAARAALAGLARPVLVGSPDAVRQVATGAGVALDGCAIADPAEAETRRRYATRYAELRAHRGMTVEAALVALDDPVLFGAMMVATGDADGLVCGAITPTADVLRTALQTIGKGAGVKTVSSFFLMLLDPARGGEKGPLVFADCGLVVEPDAEELAQIGVSSAESFAALTGLEPRVAFLSFSTAGSARHPRVEKVRKAVAGARALRPDLAIDGEFQFDAAFVPEIAASKAPESPIQGDANIFVFPNLEAGNAGYKIAQRIGGATAIGPIVQGLARPANDLSRGCSTEDIYHLIAVTGVQALSSSL